MSACAEPAPESCRVPAGRPGGHELQDLTVPVATVPAPAGVELLVLRLEDAARHGCAHLQELYSAAERDEIAAMTGERRRAEKLAGKLAAKLVVCRALERRFGLAAAPSEIEVLAAIGPVRLRTGGAPSAVAAALERLRCSISHSGDLACSAVAACPVGVDIEGVRPLNPDEVTEIGGAPLAAAVSQADDPSARSELPIAVFTRKEAVLKAAGSGLAAGLASVETGVGPVHGAFEAVHAGVAYRGHTLPVGGAILSLATPCQTPGSPPAGTGASAAAVPRTSTERKMAAVWREVLARGDIGVDAGFGQLGGNAAAAARIASRVRAVFGVGLRPGLPDARSSIAGLSLLVDESRRDRFRSSPIHALPRDSADGSGDCSFPASFGQEQLWTLDRIEPVGAAYAMVWGVRLRGVLDAAALRAALRQLVDRHESLRTRFAMGDGALQQVVGRAADLPCPAVAIDAPDPAAREAEAGRLMAAAACEPFDLGRGPLARASLYRLSAQDHVLLLVIHHAVCDGASMETLLRELAAGYEAACRGASVNLPALRIQYADYAVWQRQTLVGDALDAHLRYWRQELADAPALLELPADRARPPVSRHIGDSRSFELPAPAVRALRALSRQGETTLFVTLLAAFQALLHRLSGQPRVVVGVPMAGRTADELESVTGYFVNALPVKADFSADPPFMDCLRQVHTAARAARDHVSLPFSKLVAEIRPDRVAGCNPLFQVTFLLDRAADGPRRMGGLTAESHEVFTPTAKFDLSVLLREEDGVIRGRWEYDTALFDAASIARLAGQYDALLAGVLADPQQRVSSLPLLSAAERHRLLVEWNATARAYDTGRCVHADFEEQARRTPDAVAVVCGDVHLTYRELDACVNRLATHLREQGVGRDAPVGLCAERSLEMVVGLFAILKAGGAYVPLDPDYPAERLAFMLEDAQPCVVLTQARLAGLTPAPASGRVVLLDGWANPAAAVAARAPAPVADGASLAYVIYTSGSTGRPKGVEIPHRALANHMHWMQEAFPLGPSDSVLHKTPFSFDASVWEFFAPLLAGGRLVLARPGGHRDPAYLIETIRRERVTILQLVPSLLRLLLDEPSFAGCRSLRHVFCGGEALPAEAVRRFCGLLDAELHNLYGPTEVTIDSVCYSFDRRALPDVVPIGRPVANVRAYILDDRGQPTPIGAPGELYLGGVQVARGYHGREDLTAQRFVPDPFSGEPGGRLFRTGDRARYRSDGNIEFLGRLDDLVKVRGCRVEPGEVESALARHPGVRRAAVVVRGNASGESHLAACIVPVAAAAPPSPSDLRGFLLRTLPDYMVPTVFVLLDDLPATPSGKVDRQALPAAAPAQLTPQPAYEAPRQPVETALAGLWAMLLGVERVGLHDNFFDLGGHSLTAIQLASHIRRTLHAEVPVRTIFENPTIASLASCLQASSAGQHVDAVWSPPDPTAVIVEPVLVPVAAAFLARAAASPSHTAIVQGGVAWSYCELSAAAQGVARMLLAHDTHRGEVVAVAGPRSPEVVAAIVGVFLSGGVLLTLDPSLPAGRRRIMLRESGARCLLRVGESAATDEALRDFDGLHILSLPRTGKAVVPGGGVADDTPLPSVGPDDPAHVFFTSGTTGVPKAVLGCHKGLSHFLAWQRRTFGVGPSDRCAQLVNLSFLAALRDVFLPLVSGAALYLPDDGDNLAAGAVLEWMERVQITLLHSVPALAQSWLAGVPDGVTLRSLRLAFLAGEPLMDSLVRQWRAAFPQAGRIVNLYGATETTLAKSYHVIPPEPTPGVQLIGIPLPEAQLLVLDDSGGLCKPGEPGEIVIRTPFLARGYMNAPAEQAKRFVPNPFRDDPSDRVFLTGDIGHYTPDGVLAIAGRRDDQVKIRGVRVEPGEVTAALGRDPRVKACIVTAGLDPRGDHALLAYVVPAAPGGVAAADLRSYLAGVLPAVMVPTGFAFLPELPMLPNGKVDRRALPAAEFAAPGSAGHVAPRTDIERSLVGFWEQSLRRPGVGITDNFFDLGGHSLLATQLASLVRQTLGVDIPMQAIFENPTIEALALEIQARSSRASAAAPAGPVRRRAGSGPAPMSFGQQQLWIMDQWEQGIAAYNIAMAVTLDGSLDEAVLERCLAEVVRRHEVFRSTFPRGAAEPAVVLQPPRPPALSRRDLSALPPARAGAEACRLAGEEDGRPFDLQTGPLMRATLLKLEARRHVLLLTLHHIVCDAWSMNILYGELSRLYEAFAAGRPSPLPELPVQYADFAAWQREYLSGETLARHLAYWTGRLRDLPTLELPADYPRPPAQTFRGGQCDEAFPLPLLEALRALARAERATLFMVVLAAFQALLARYTGQDDIVIGTPVAGRARAEFEGLIGFFVNMLVLRADASGDPAFRDLLRRARAAALDAYAHQDLPFERLVEELHPRRDPSRNPLFQVAIALQNVPQSKLELPGLTVTRLDGGYARTRFDLEVHLAEGPEGLKCSFIYNADLFRPDTVARMVGHFRQLLEGVAARPELKLSELPLLSEAESQRLLAEWNATASPYPADRCVHELFEDQVRRAPEAPALVFGGTRLTYRELNERADSLARRLRAAGVGPDVPVGVCADRSAGMVVGFLAALKAGGAYVPLDPDYPAERLAWMLADARAPVLLTPERHLERFAPGQPGVTVIRIEDSGHEAAGPRPALRPVTTPLGLAYIIYTSGSTGKPKGVCVPHQAIARLVAGADYVQLGPADVVAQMSNGAFDAATFEIWGALLNGACLVGIGRDCALSPSRLAAELARLRVSALFVTTALFNELARHVPAVFRPVRHVLFGGEECDPQAVQAVLEAGPPERLLHVYGPTEATTFATWYPVPARIDAKARVPIGRPIANTTLYLLDRFLRPVPVGVPGEICIGGPGLARGYLGAPELTAEKFVANPFEAGTRLYRTGDLARRLADGNVEFVGRRDQQVKVHGFRIEPGEVESAIRQLPGVRDALVIAQRTAAGDRRLVAYVVADADRSPSATELRAALKRSMPDYMVPSAFVPLEAFPLTPNGKVDRQALPPAEAAPSAPAGDATKPRTPAEDRLAALWCEVLGVPQAGAHDNFFDRGGHSLLGVRLMARVRQDFGVDLPLSSLFRAPTLSELAQLIERAGAGESEPAPHETDAGSCLIEIRPGGTPPALLLVPGGRGGDVELTVCGRMLRHIGVDCPVYGFRARGFDGTEPLHGSVRAMAAAYIEALDAIQPAGPYQLVGECLGGLVVYEMAQQLTARGDEVAFLALLDTVCPGGRDWPAAWMQRLRLRVAGWLLRGRALARGKAGPPVGWGAALAARHLKWTRSMYAQTLRCYRPRPCGAKLTLVLSEESLAAAAALPRWQRLARGGLDVQRVPGDHITFIRDHAKTTGEVVGRCLRRARGDSGLAAERPAFGR